MTGSSVWGLGFRVQGRLRGLGHHSLGLLVLSLEDSKCTGHADFSRAGFRV